MRKTVIFPSFKDQSLKLKGITISDTYSMFMLNQNLVVDMES
jgi:hypothetical protein